MKIEVNSDFECFGANWINGDNIDIVLFLKDFKFRKNVNPLRVARLLNYYFLIEYICAIMQQEDLFKDNDNFTNEHCIGCPPEECLRCAGVSKHTFNLQKGLLRK